jgi:phosphatidate cytidylyltransferase
VSKQFKQRLIVSGIAIFLLFSFIYFSFHPVFKLFFIISHALFVSIALSEYYYLVEKKNFQPLTQMGICLSFIYILLVGWAVQYPSPFFSIPLLLLLAGFLFSFLLFFTPSRTSPIVNMALSTFGILYVTLPLSCVVMLNYFSFPHNGQDGRLWLTYGILVSKMTDVGAYFSGKLWGKHQLAPFISPKKTLEGSIGGFFTALFTSIFFTQIFTNHGFYLSFQQSLWMGALLGILAQLGDLTESLLKRDAQVKDSSHLPGLGGLLDIIDSLVFTLPLLYLFLQMQWIG